MYLCEKPHSRSPLEERRRISNGVETYLDWGRNLLEGGLNQNVPVRRDNLLEFAFKNQIGHVIVARIRFSPLERTEFEKFQQTILAADQILDVAKELAVSVADGFAEFFTNLWQQSTKLLQSSRITGRQSASCQIFMKKISATIS